MDIIDFAKVREARLAKAEPCTLLESFFISPQLDEKWWLIADN
jgi:hypothetical protein